MKMRTVARAAYAIAAACVAAVMTAGAVEAQTLKVAHIYPPGNIWYDTTEAYGKAVEARSGGKIKFQIAHSGTTGDWPKSIEALLIGTNDIVLQSIGTLDRYNIVAAIEAYPYMIRDIDHFKKTYYGPVGAALLDEIAAKTKFRIVGAGYRGARHLSTNERHRVASPNDLRGVKLRVPPLKMYRMTWEYLGASPVPVGIDELFTSLQQNVVDGQENPLEHIQAAKYNEVQKYVTETAHVMGAMTFIFSEARWHSFPEETRKILKEEGEKAMLAATERMIKTEDAIKRDLQAKGMEFVPVNKQEWSAKLVPMIKDFPELAPWVEKIQAIK
jgi:tripartite ATP-independent transporter DctP family solute receptor